MAEIMKPTKISRFFPTQNEWKLDVEWTEEFRDLTNPPLPDSKITVWLQDLYFCHGLTFCKHKIGGGHSMT